MQGRSSYPDAIARLSKALELVPHSPKALVRRGELMYLSRQFDEAVRDLDAAIAADDVGSATATTSSNKPQGARDPRQGARRDRAPRGGRRRLRALGAGVLARGQERQERDRARRGVEAQARAARVGLDQGAGAPAQGARAGGPPARVLAVRACCARPHRRLRRRVQDRSAHAARRVRDPRAAAHGGDGRAERHPQAAAQQPRGGGAARVGAALARLDGARAQRDPALPSSSTPSSRRASCCTRA